MKIKKRHHELYRPEVTLECRGLKGLFLAFCRIFKIGIKLYRLRLQADRFGTIQICYLWVVPKYKITKWKKEAPCTIVER